jgi:hypothetical protein
MRWGGNAGAIHGVLIPVPHNKVDAYANQTTTTVES